jgi:RNA polymerase sigma-70 factor (ECF subfamily)
MMAHAVAMATGEDLPEADRAERLGRLFDAHHARLYALARRMRRSPDAARDLVQETFLRAARAHASIPDGSAHEEAWLVRVLVNVCRDEWRREAVRHRAAAALVASPDPHATESALVARSTIWRALDRLPPRRRAIVILYEIEGAPIPAIARMLGVTAVTVRWHLSRGRRELRRAITAPPGREPS